MLRTRKTKSNDDTIKGGSSSSVFKGIKGKRTKQKQILNLLIGFTLACILGAFFSLFVYDIEDLEEASAVSFRDGGGKKLDDVYDKSRKRRNHEEEKEKEKNRSVKDDGKEKEEHSTRSNGRNGSRLGSALTPNAQFDMRSSFAQSFSLSKGNGGSFPYRYVFVLFLFARPLRLFQ